MSSVAGMSQNPAATPGDPEPEARDHRPVLLHPLIESLQPRPGHIAVDATLGAGGVVAALLERVLPGGRVIATDRDGAAIATAKRRFARAGDAVTIVQGDFAELDIIVNGLGIPSVDCVALDLGISSLQLDDPLRGFSFRLDGPLDMRMDAGSGVTAADLVNTLGADELAAVIRDYGEERFARPIATAVAAARKKAAVTRTGQLRRSITDTLPR